MRLAVKFTTQFKKDLKLANEQNKNNIKNQHIYKLN